MPRLESSIHLQVLTALFAAVFVSSGCQGGSSQKDPDSSSDQSSKSDDDEGKGEDESQKGGDDDDESDESEPLPELPKAKPCKGYAPKVAFPDTNPSSETYKDEVSPQDYKGEVSLWIPTFDCDC